MKRIVTKQCLLSIIRLFKTLHVRIFKLLFLSVFTATLFMGVSRGGGGGGEGGRESGPPWKITGYMGF